MLRNQLEELIYNHLHHQMVEFDAILELEMVFKAQLVVLDTLKVVLNVYLVSKGQMLQMR